MSCALTQGFNLDCRDAVGGIKEIYIIEIGNVSSITEASGTVSVIAKAPGKRFWKYSLIRETSHFSETLTVSEANGTTFAAQTGEIILNKRQASVRNELMLLAKGNVAIVAVDNTGNGWLYGREYGMMVNNAVAASGTAWGDRNGYTVPFSGNEKELAPIIPAGVILTLETPGA